MPETNTWKTPLEIDSFWERKRESVCVCVCVYIVRTHWMYQYYVLYLAWCGFNEPKLVAEFLILITNICCVIDWINYYIIAKQCEMAPIKTLGNQLSDSHGLPAGIDEFVLVLPLWLLAAFCCVYFTPMNKYVTAGFYISTCLGEVHSVIKQLWVLEELVEWELYLLGYKKHTCPFFSYNKTNGTH